LVNGGGGGLLVACSPTSCGGGVLWLVSPRPPPPLLRAALVGCCGFVWGVCRCNLRNVAVCVRAHKETRVARFYSLSLNVLSGTAWLTPALVAAASPSRRQDGRRRTIVATARRWGRGIVDKSDRRDSRNAAVIVARSEARLPNRIQHVSVGFGRSRWWEPAGGVVDALLSLRAVACDDASGGAQWIGRIERQASRASFGSATRGGPLHL
jgi:hypothetical protein